MLRTQTTQTPDRGTVLGKAVLRSAERLNLSGKTLAAVLGLSEPQISRLKKGTAPLNEQTKAFELAALLVRAFRSLDAITGGDETAHTGGGCRAYVAGDPIPGEPHGNHRCGKQRVPHGGPVFRRIADVDEINRAPVSNGAFSHGGSQSQEANQHQGARWQRENRFATVAICWGNP